MNVFHYSMMIEMFVFHYVNFNYEFAQMHNTYFYTEFRNFNLIYQFILFNLPEAMNHYVTDVYVTDVY